MKRSFPDYNILLINLDGIRQDKVDICPTLKSFAEKNLYFPKMFTVSPYTLTSHHSIISGTYPSQNGVDAYYHMFRFKKDEIVTIPEILKRVDYNTCCDVASDSLMPKKGFDEKNVFDEKTVDFKQRHKEFIERLAKKSKFFLFLQYSEPHKHLVEEVMKKYDQKSNDDEYFQRIKENDERYNSYMPECDEYVKMILNTLQDLDIEDKTIVIFHSDHGTSIGEKKGEKFYGVYVYDYTINVFCIMNFPNVSSKMIEFQCRTTDIFPTIADIAGINIEDCDKLAGRSLFPLVEGVEKADREVFVETGGLYGYWPSPKKHNVFCVRKNCKKLIYNDTSEAWEFYDLKNDPKELKNIFNEKSEDVIYFKERLLYYLNHNNINTKLTTK